ncbi:MAG: hypothetical protein Q9170_002798 [Blastenia crenularia]
MDSLKNAMGMGEGGNKQEGQTGEQASSGGGLMDKFNSMAGGGKESEKNEDYLDKGLLHLQLKLMLLLLKSFPGIDMVQEKVLGQGPQDNESAIEQAKDEQMSDFIRGKYKSSTGNEFPVADK